MSQENEDETLIAAYLGGSEEAFAVLYERYKRPFYGYLNSLLPYDGALVDDVFQQSWLRVIDNLAGYGDSGKFGAWLFRIGRNMVIDVMRRNKRNGFPLSIDAENMPDMPAPAGCEPWREMDESEVGEAVARAIEQLPPEQREVFLLRRQDLSFKEIAEMQQCTVNTALGRMHYAVKNLQKYLTGELSI